MKPPAFLRPSLARMAMMPPSPARIRTPHLLGVAAAAAVLLVACSKPAEAPAAASVTSAYAAVARGKVDIEGGLLTLAMPRE